MEFEIKPCPKCGNQKVSVRGIFGGSDGKGCARVKCKQCGFAGPFAETAEEAVKVWNILIVEVFERMNPHHEKEGDAMKKHEPCPVCGKANMEVKQMTLSKEEIIRGERKFRAVCRKCGWAGPERNNPNDALWYWDKTIKQIHGENEPKEISARIPENVALIERIISGLDCCLMDKPCEDCPYNDGNRGSTECISHLLKLATKLLSDYRDATVLMNAEKKDATRKTILDAATTCVCKERNDQYGEPEDCFQDIANLWAAYKGVEIDAFEVAMMMALLKVARAKVNPQHTDNYIDLCGYGSIAGELANKEENK